MDGKLIIDEPSFTWKEVPHPAVPVYHRTANRVTECPCCGYKLDEQPTYRVSYCACCDYCWAWAPESGAFAAALEREIALAEQEIRKGLNRYPWE